MAPSGDAYNVDWIFSNNSNVHVATHRDWFTSFTPLSTCCGHIAFSGSRLEVGGIGTVELNVKLYPQKRAGQPNSRTLTLHNVLYAPTSDCNIIGNPIYSDYMIQLSQNGGTMTDNDGKRAGTFAFCTLWRLCLHGARGG